MEKMLIIDGREVGFKASALTPRLYRNRYRRDIIQDMNKLKVAFEKAQKAVKLPKPAEDAPAEEQQAYKEAVQEAQLSVMDLQLFEDVAFVMARQYDPAIPKTPEEWLDEFSTFSIFEILPEIMKLWQLNQTTTSKSKNG